MELLELKLSPLEDPLRFEVAVEQSPAGEGKTVSELPFSDAPRDGRATIMRLLELSRFDPRNFAEEERQWSIGAGIVAKNGETFHYNYLVNIGQALYQALFPQGSTVAGLLQRSIALAEDKSTKLVVRLKFATDVVTGQLADYPWELLHDGRQDGGFLCHHQVEFSRYIAYEAVTPNLPRAKRLNVLLVSSAASDREFDLGQISDREGEAVRKGLKSARDRGDIVLEELAEPTFAELRAYLTENPGDKAPHVLHFDGHGLFGKRCPNPACRAMNLATNGQCQKCQTELPPPQGYLLFEDSDGKADYISAKDLGTMLRQFGMGDGPSPARGVVLVVLSACQSGMAMAGESVFNGTAQNLIAHRVPAVVAMQYSVEVDSATKFARQFYGSLGQKNSLAMAVSQARAAMGVDGNQWYRPVLYLRWQDNEGGQLFALSPEASPNPVAPEPLPSGEVKAREMLIGLERR